MHIPPKYFIVIDVIFYVESKSENRSWQSFLSYWIDLYAMGKNNVANARYIQFDHTSFNVHG